MKPVKLILGAIMIMTIGITISARAQDKTQALKSKTESFKVWGKCEMCKNRIEKAVIEEGASTASWDQKTKILTVTYDPRKTSIDTLCKKLALVGHDTEKYKSPDDVYAKLPSCCHYDRSK